MGKDGKRASLYLSCKVVKAFPKKNQYGEDGYGVCFPGGYYDWRPKEHSKACIGILASSRTKWKRKGRLMLLRCATCPRTIRTRWRSRKNRKEQAHIGST